MEINKTTLNQFTCDLYDSDISNCMGGLGGCKDYVESDYPNYYPLINAYLSNKIDSIAATSSLNVAENNKF